MGKSIKDIPPVTKDQIIAIFRDPQNADGLTFKDLCRKALDEDNPTEDICQKKVKGSYMSLCHDGTLVPHQTMKGIRILVGEAPTSVQFPPNKKNDQALPVPLPARPTNELNATVFGVNFVPVRRGKIAPLYAKLLRPVTIEAKPLRFEYAVVWVGPGKDINTSQWTVVGQVEGSRILLSDEAPDFTALPYTSAFIKLFVADNGQTDEGLYSIGQLTPDWITWIGSLERVK